MVRRGNAAVARTAAPTKGNSRAFAAWRSTSSREMSCRVHQSSRMEMARPTAPGPRRLRALAPAAGAQLDEIEDFLDEVFADRAVRLRAGEYLANLVPEGGQPLGGGVAAVEEVADRDDS